MSAGKGFSADSTVFGVQAHRYEYMTISTRGGEVRIDVRFHHCSLVHAATRVVSCTRTQ